MFGFGRIKRASDETLLLEFSRGKHRAFEELVARYGTAVEGYARRLLQNSQQAEEVMADTFEKLARDRGTWPLQGTLRSYIFAIARNRCFDLLRRRRREQEACSRVFEQESRRLSAPHPEAVARMGELARTLEESLARMPEGHRDVVLLRLVHGLSGDETAAILGCTEDQVRSQLSYARKLIRKHLLEHEGAQATIDIADAEKEVGAV